MRSSSCSSSEVRRGRVLAGLLLIAVSHGAARAAELERADISFRDRTWHYVFATVLDGPLDAVRTVITDYDRLDRINDDVVASRVLERHGDGRLRRLLALKPCVLLFCFELSFVEDVEETPHGVVTRVVPGAGSFVDGIASWRLEDLGGRTRVTVEARQTPDFWIPPVLGPLLLARVFRHEIAETCARIETLARHATP